MTKAIRMTVTTTVVLTAPLPPEEQFINMLTDQHRKTIRERMKADMTRQAEATSSKIKNILVNAITLVDVP